MQFPSIIFLFYLLPAVLLAYLLCSFSRRLQNFCLLAACLAFYAWGSLTGGLFLLFSVLVNWFLGGLAGHLRLSSPNGARKAATGAIAFNLAGLLLYAYLGPAANSLGAWLNLDVLRFTPPVPPPGISFFTLHAISYIMDIWRGDAQAEQGPLHVGLYMSFFPLLPAGPIIRFTDFSLQMRERKQTWALFSDGCARFAAGIAKCVLLAAAMQAVSDRVFELTAAGNQVTVVPVALAWLGLVAFALQIYYHLSGYADMAIGMGAMFGFVFGENFAHPYSARSLTEFWQRWNISLLAWFKTYIPLPLFGFAGENAAKGGGETFSHLRRVAYAWALLGFWHGAGLTFIAWGMWQFIFLMFESVTLFHRRKIPRPLCHAYLILVAIVGWLFSAPPAFLKPRPICPTCLA